MVCEIVVSLRGCSLNMPAKNESRDELVSIISRQQQEIKALRKRVEALEANEIGQLLLRVAELEQQVEDLQAWKLQAQEQLRSLESKSTMSLSLAMFVGASVVALLGEKFAGILDSTDAETIEELLGIADNNLTELEAKLGAEKVAELEESLGNAITKLLNTVQRLDKKSQDVWQRQRTMLEKRAATLPPLKKALFESLKRLADPSNLGTLLLDFVSTSPEMVEKLTTDDLSKFELFADFLDTVSNLWPLTVTNSLAPILRHVGFDEAAEAAGEILDQLETKERVPRHLVHKVRSDLVEAKVIDKRTKPSTIAEYLKNGHELQQLGCSPDEAAYNGILPVSATQLKRAKRTYEGLQALYDRTTEYPDCENLLELEDFGQALKRVADERIDSLKEVIVLEFA